MQRAAVVSALDLLRRRPGIRKRLILRQRHERIQDGIQPCDALEYEIRQIYGRYLSALDLPGQLRNRQLFQIPLFHVPNPFILPPN